MFAFDADSRVTATGTGGVYAAELTRRWDGTAGAVNGGYMLATCVRALARHMPFPDPVVISGFFLRPGAAGPASIRTSVIRSGRTTAFGESVLAQDGKDIVRATAAFARLGRDGPVFTDGAPPELPPPADCPGTPAGRPGQPSIAERIEFRSPALPGWLAAGRSPGSSAAGTTRKTSRSGIRPAPWSPSPGSWP